MAVSNNTEEVKTVLTIDTSKSASSMKELREQIKSLKDQLVGLDQGTEEYSNTVTQLGEKMHTLREINEEVARTNTDFGTTIGNVTNVMAGGVAAAQGLTASLSLLGIEMGDDNKLTQTLVKSMALLQALSSMDRAIKSFKALSVVIKSNIAAAGGLGKALKALAVSNPFTAILAAAAAVAATVALITKRNRELAEQEKEVAAQAREAAEAIRFMNLQLDESNVQNKLAYDASGTQEEVDKVKTEILSLVGELNKSGQTAEQQAKNWGTVMTEQYNNAVKSGDKYRQTLLQIVQIQWELRGVQADYLEGEIKEAEYKKAQLEANNKVYKTYADYANSKKKNDKKEVDLEKQKYDLAMKRLNLQKTLDDTELNARYEEEKRAAQGNAEELLAIEERYQAARLKLNQKYYTDAIALAEQFKATRKTESEQLDVDQTIANLNKSLQEGADAWEAYKKENAEANVELKQSKFEAEESIKSLDRQTAAMEREIEITRQHNERYLELIQQKWTMQADLDAEAIRYQQEQLQNSNVGIDADLEALKTRHDTEMALLQEQYDAKLIAEEEFQQKKAEIEAQYNNESMALLQQHFENEAQLDELAVQAKKNETERKKELEEVYMSAISSITSSITAVLNEAANAENVSFEDQKKLKIASTIITTLTSAMEAFQSVASIPIVGPALGAAAAASTIAVGMMNVNKIRQTKKNSTGNVSASVGAIQTIQTPTQMTNITGFSDDVTLPEQRVYVLESDITDAQNHVRVTQNNNSF